MWLVAGIELIVAAQAVDLAAGGRPEPLGAGAAAAFAVVREWVDTLSEDRPVGPDVERLAAQALTGGEMLERVRAAVGVA
jgi:histidine ammonia-lyase